MDEITYAILHEAVTMGNIFNNEWDRRVKVQFSPLVWPEIDQICNTMRTHQYFEVNPTPPHGLRLKVSIIDIYLKEKELRRKLEQKEIEESEIRMLDVLMKTNEIVDYPKVKKERKVLFYVAIIELIIILVGLFSTSPK